MVPILQQSWWQGVGWLPSDLLPTGFTLACNLNVNFKPLSNNVLFCEATEFNYGKLHGTHVALE